MCFKYCITANFYKDQVEKIKTLIRKLDKEPIKGPAHKMAVKRALECGKNYENYFNQFNWKGLDFPISIDDISIFEKNNGISVNCFKNVGKDLIPIRQTNLNSEKHVDLLLVEDVENEDSHFILIHDRSAFEGRLGKKRHYYCNYCQKRFLAKDVMLRHSKECPNLNLGIMRFPKSDTYVYAISQYM